jgi:hypothetical protein
MRHNRPKHKARPSPRMFADSDGRAWVVRFTPEIIRRCLDGGHDLAALTRRPASEVIDYLHHGARFVDVIFIACETQATERGFTPEKFAVNIVGGVSEANADQLAMALLAAIADAFGDSCFASSFSRRYPRLFEE